MPYRMRFFDTSDDSLSLKDIEVALKREDPAYRLEIFEDSERPLADMYFGDASTLKSNSINLEMACSTRRFRRCWSSSSMPKPTAENRSRRF